MGEPAFPGELEQMILLAILRLAPHAYALGIRRELREQAGRSVSRGTLYKTLDRMGAKGLVRYVLDEPTPDRGGHARRAFEVTPYAVEVLAASRSALLNLWSGLDTVLEGRS